MRRKSLLRITVDILATLAMTSALASSAGAAAKYQTLHKFTGGKDGASPHSALIFDKLGNRYGTTALGGANKAGTVFSLTPATSGWTKTVLYSFTGEATAPIPMLALSPIQQAISMARQ
jgi:uncharacterized repeat protein (TIGR03803 family)